MKIGRFKFKYRQDLKEFQRRLVYQCAKEVRRRFARCQKA
jgi:DNA helicase INO80